MKSGVSKVHFFESNWRRFLLSCEFSQEVLGWEKWNKILCYSTFFWMSHVSLTFVQICMKFKNVWNGNSPAEKCIIDAVGRKQIACSVEHSLVYTCICYTAHCSRAHSEVYYFYTYSYDAARCKICLGCTTEAWWVNYYNPILKAVQILSEGTVCFLSFHLLPKSWIANELSKDSSIAYP